jgi:hypothetical protein
MVFDSGISLLAIGLPTGFADGVFAVWSVLSAAELFQRSFLSAWTMTLFRRL